ncbi:baseplate protein [Shigella sonnei]|uniref:Baseplate protein n=1 Tax=Salmonella montevideo TaxID=115981 RepID=A0A5T7HKH0_SALMO|nr:baseplate protein [Salmonella enterica subsp. enterica serovar Montevideo]EES3078209.1 baseplate protein [Escherichia coli]EFX1560861.1 baseplate protein [Shigella sonnei]EIA0886745.1 baseplate protein [Salmonella enterica]ECT2603601.1 baseplate protein [Salmonella enterica subsp. enterica serovar Montevideo]
MKRRAQIVGTVHPAGLMRAQVRVLPDWNGVPDDDLPWAEYLLPIGNAFVPTVKGDLVWVEFPYLDVNGRIDTRRPMIVGAAQDAPGGIPNVAPEASGKGNGWTPPEVDGAPPRPQISATKDFVIHRNNILEVRTAGGGYEIANTAAGSRIGMNESGQIYIIGPADVIVNAGGSVNVKSANNINVKGENIAVTANGDIAFKAEGTFQATASNFDFKKG